MTNNHEFEYEIHEDIPDHKFRTEIPNIIFELDLSIYEREVYIQLKRICGDGGKCWKTRKEMAAAIGISQTKFIQCLKKLKSVQPIINCPLIQVTERKREDGMNFTNVISIVPIWRKNGDFYRGGGCTTCTGGGAPHAPRGAPHAPKEDLYKEDLYIEEQKNKQKSLEQDAPDGAVKILEVPKPKKQKREYPEASVELANTLIEIQKTKKPDIKPPSFDPFIFQVNQMICHDGRQPEKIVAVFRWVLYCPYRGAKMVGKQAMKILRDNFDEYEIAMNAKFPSNSHKIDRRRRDDEGNLEEMTRLF